jgi:hypothetical protein
MRLYIADRRGVCQLSESHRREHSHRQVPLHQRGRGQALKPVAILRLNRALNQVVNTRTINPHRLHIPPRENHPQNTDKKAEDAVVFYVGDILFGGDLYGRGDFGVLWEYASVY